MAKVVIGSRGSALALWQANYTQDRLEAEGFETEITIIRTKGDQVQHLGFDKLEGKGFFTKEIEDALLAGQIDLAVHSCKDLPTESPDGLVIGAYSARAAAGDVLLLREDRKDIGNFLQLPRGAVVGTSSARRKAQLLSFRPDIQLKDIRGNVPTRLRKLQDGEFDAILLAAAGLDRLGTELGGLMDGVIREDLSPAMFIPAPAQGVLAYQVRENDGRMAVVLNALNDAGTERTAEIERGLLNAFQGGCQVPIGIFAESNGDGYDVWVSRADSWNTIPRRMYFGKGDDISADAVTAAFRAAAGASVFISTDLGEGDIFRRHLMALGCSVSGEALIRFSAVGFEPAADTDWLFFSSKNAARFYFDACPALPDGMKIAAINRGTAQVLAELGHPPDFTGSGGNMETIAAAFDQTTGDRVVFPRASHSRRTIQQMVRSKKIADLVVYDNFPVAEVRRREEDVLVFTSPMNAGSYFSKYGLRDDQAAVAIGASTAAEISSHGWPAMQAFEPTRWALVDAVTRIICTRSKTI
jgi:hydroxymethylbilane synthase